MNRDRFSALPVHIRHHILRYFESEFVKQDLQGNVSYIGQAALGGVTTAANVQREFESWRRHRFAWVSRQFREDFLDLFFRLNKFEFGSGPLLIAFLTFTLTGRLKSLASLRFTLRQHANVPRDADCGELIDDVRIIYKLLSSGGNLKELKIYAQLHWNPGEKAACKLQSLTFPVENALSYFQGKRPNRSPISFGPLVEKDPRRHGYDEDPPHLERIILWGLRGKVERVKGILATAFETVLKERREQEERLDLHRLWQESRRMSVAQGTSGGEAQKRSQSSYPWKVLYPPIPNVYPWRKDLYPPIPNVYPWNVYPRIPNVYPQIPNVNPQIPNVYPWRDHVNPLSNHFFPQAGLSEPRATVQPTTAVSQRSHDLLVQKILSWIDLSKPLYLLPTRDPNLFAYYLTMMEWAWNNGLEQSRIDVMTWAIMARVDGNAFQAWLHTPSGVPGLLKETESGRCG